MTPARRAGLATIVEGGTRGARYSNGTGTEGERRVYWKTAEWLMGAGLVQISGGRVVATEAGRRAHHEELSKGTQLSLDVAR